MQRDVVILSWLLTLARAAVRDEPISYAELLTFKEDSVFHWENFSSWTAPSGGTTYCAAPVSVPGGNGSEPRIDVYAVGYDCCSGPGGFECYRDEKVYEAAPGEAAGEATRLPRLGLEVDFKERAFFRRAVEKSPVYWQGGRQKWSPKPIMVYVVPQAVNHCRQEELSVCGEGRNLDSCPPPVAKAFDLDCPRMEQCFRSWNQDMGMFHHLCVPRRFRDRFTTDDEDPPDWWEDFRRQHDNHPNAPGARQEIPGWPPTSRDGVYDRDNQPSDQKKWQDAGSSMWNHAAEAPEWGKPGASPKWRRPSGDMWQPGGQSTELPPGSHGPPTALLRGVRRT